MARSAGRHVTTRRRRHLSAARCTALALESSCRSQGRARSPGGARRRPAVSATQSCRTASSSLLCDATDRRRLAADERQLRGVRGRRDCSAARAAAWSSCDGAGLDASRRPPRASRRPRTPANARREGAHRVSANLTPFSPNPNPSPRHRNATPNATPGATLVGVRRAPCRSPRGDDGPPLYLSGTPGTGGRRAGAPSGGSPDRSLPPFREIFVNGMKLTSPFEVYSILSEALTGQAVKHWSRAARSRFAGRLTGGSCRQGVWQAAEAQAEGGEQERSSLCSASSCLALRSR